MSTIADTTPMEPKAACDLILSGQAPNALTVNGNLDFSGNTSLTALPAGLRVRRLTLDGCTELRDLPRGLRCFELELQGTRITALPADICVEYRLDLTGCQLLEELPAGLKVGSLVLRDCTALKALPDGLAVSFLDISGCTGLRDWPAHGAIQVGRLNARGCTRIASLPAWLTHVAQLDVSGCVNLATLPDHLRVSSWLDLANTAITSLPEASRGVQLRWHGVPIDERVAFHPETITVREVLDQPNVELRRVLMERMGYETFLDQAQAQVRDQDEDAGGERRLLEVPLEGDEPLVCLAVSCPSTGRRYMLRVPPRIRRCHEAAAWIAGFDDPDQYHPIAET